MLVLSRKANQSITLDCGVEISVVAVKGNRVKLGITAPDSVRILRSELLPVTSHWSEVEHPIARTCLINRSEPKAE